MNDTLDAAAPSSILDIIYVCAVGLFSLYVCIVSVGIVAYRNYPPLAARSPRLLLLGAVGALVWVGASVVADNHLAVRPGGCTLWSFWLQYVAGHSLWITAFLSRLAQLYQMFVVRKPGHAEYVMWVVCMAPVVALCCLVEYYGATRYLGPCEGSIELRIARDIACGCSTPLGWRVALLVVVLSRVPIALWLWVQLKRSTVRPMFHQHVELQRGLVLALALTVPALFVHFRGLLDAPLGRFIFSAPTLAIVAYFFTVTTVPPVLARWRNDETYFRECMQSSDGGAALDPAFARYLAMPDARTYFFEYVEGIKGYENHAACARDIAARREGAALVSAARDIISLYVAPGALQDVRVPMEISIPLVSAQTHSSVALFDTLDLWLCAQMYQHFAAFTRTEAYTAATVAASLRASELATGSQLGLVKPWAGG